MRTRLLRRTALVFVSGRWLERLSQLAQVVLAVVAVFGYFYTVVPLYQKSVVEEEIARGRAELEKTYKTLRLHVTTSFVYDLGVRCTDLFMPEPLVTITTRKQDEDGVLDKLLSLDVARCIADNFATSPFLSGLRTEDRADISFGVQTAAVRLKALRAEAVRAYEAVDGLPVDGLPQVSGPALDILRVQRAIDPRRADERDLKARRDEARNQVVNNYRRSALDAIKMIGVKEERASASPSATTTRQDLSPSAGGQ